MSLFIDLGKTDCHLCASSPWSEKPDEGTTSTHLSLRFKVTFRQRLARRIILHASQRILSRATATVAKQLLRQQLLQQRAQQARSELAQCSARIQQHLLDWLQPQAPATLCAFAGNRHEIKLLPLLQKLQQLGWRTALPVIDPERPGYMQMHLWQAGDALRNNRFAIPEPASECAQIAAQDINVCLLPLLAFADRGERLGMGGGYYDRWLPQAASSMLRVGVACNWQRQPVLPLDQWDQNMHYVCTESGLQRCGAAA